MNNFYDYFIHSIKNPNLSNVITKYFSLKNRFKHFVFVEGFDDKTFYSVVLKKKIPAKFPADICYIISGGKANVLGIYEYLFENVSNKKLLNNHYFIVDKDYDTNIDFTKKYKRVSLTLHYSFENYFFEYENLICILKELKVSEKQITLFLNLLKEYLDNIIDYETLLCLNVGHNVFTGVYHNNLNEISLSIVDDKIIIDNEFSKRIKEQIKSLGVDYHNKFLFLKKQLINDYLNIRGHDFELFFDKMMENYLIDFKLKNIIKNTELLSKIKVNILLK